MVFKRFFNLFGLGLPELQLYAPIQAFEDSEASKEEPSPKGCSELGSAAHSCLLSSCPAWGLELRKWGGAKPSCDGARLQLGKLRISGY